MVNKMTTPVQQKIYRYIEQYLAEHGYSPALVEIAEGIGISPKSISLVSRSIHTLVEAGLLRFDRKGYRNLRVVEEGQKGLLPLLGRIAAGTPIEAIENKQFIELASLFNGADYFALEVKGDSMIEEGIFDSDLVICRSVSRAEEGDIVVALVDNQDATLKRISYQISDRITLIPANPTMKPKAYLPQRVQIQGIYVGLLRLERNHVATRRASN